MVGSTGVGSRKLAGVTTSYGMAGVRIAAGGGGTGAGGDGGASTEGKR